MRWRYMVTAIVLSVLAAAGASATYLRVSRLKDQANRLLLLSDQKVAEPFTSLQSRIADAQLDTLDERRALLLEAFSWQRVEILLILFSVTSAMSSYVLYLYARLREQLERGAPDLIGVPTERRD